MGNFDDAWGGAVDAEIGEMGTKAVLRERVGAKAVRTIEGVKTDSVESHGQVAGGKRAIVSFTFFTNNAGGLNVVKGWVVEVLDDAGKMVVTGRVVGVQNLDGAGVELRCGPLSTRAVGF